MAKTNDNKVRVRYAPSPTGHLHIGNARTALFNYLYARHHDGQMIVRIEDTDQKRNIAGGEESQLRFMAWLGITWDEGPDIGGAYGPYRQTERLTIYEQYAQQLIKAGRAYHCYCTEEEMAEEREAQMAQGQTPQYSGTCRELTVEQKQAFEAEGRVPSLRFLVDSTKEYTFEDMVKGHVKFEAGSSGDFVIVKKDGIPTYNFAVVVDDHLMAISHVLRGEDHLSNTPRQLMLYEALGWTPPTFAHMTLIVNEQRRKLSKRDESIIQFIEQYHDLGYLPEALFNFIALLGWSPEGEEELFAADEIVAQFDTARLSRSPAVFDTDKLRWMNHTYIKTAELDRITELAIPYLQRAGHLPETLDAATKQWVTSLVGLLQEKLTYVAEIEAMSELFFAEQATYDAAAEEVLAAESAPTVLNSFKQQIEQSSSFDVADIKAMIKAVQTDTGYKGKALFMAIRAALTGQTHGPDLNMTLHLLGKEKVLARLQTLLSS